MNELIDDMHNGNWSVAIEKFKSINPTGKEYGDFLDSLEDIEEIRNLALLGFYAREYNAYKTS